MRRRFPLRLSCAPLLLIATNMDLLLTFIAIAGTELPTDRTLDGRDISPLMLGEPFFEDGPRRPHRQAWITQ